MENNKEEFWEDQDVDLFGETQEKDDDFGLEDQFQLESDDPKKSKDEEDPEENENDDSGEEENEGEIDLFEEEENEEEDNDDDTDLFENDDDEGEEDFDNDESSSKNLINSLKEKGLIDFEPEEDKEYDESDYDEILEEEFDNKIETRVEDLLKSLPDSLKAMNQYVINGGNVSTFLQEIQKDQEFQLNDDLDLEKEENLEEISKKFLLKDGHDEDLLESQIELLKDNDKLKSYVKKKYGAWKEKRKQAKEERLESQKESRKARKRKFKKLKSELSDSLKSGEVGGYKLSKKDVKELPSYMMDRNVSIDNGNEVTELQKDLVDILNDKEKAPILAKIVKGGLDFDFIKEEIENGVSKKVRKGVRRKGKTPNKSVKNKKKDKPLADYF